MKRRAFLVASILLAFASLLSAAAIAQSNPVPFVNQPLVPTSVAPGHGAFTLTVNGTSFCPGATVTFNGHAKATTYVSGDQLKAEIGSADVSRAHTAAITVMNPGNKTASNVVYFPIGSESSTAAFALLPVALNLPSGTHPGAFAVGDFNHDGKLDVAYSTDNATINVLFGNGDGTFQPRVSTVFNININNSGQKCYGVDALVAGDFNGDGNVDLAMGYFCQPTFGGGGFDVVFTALGTGSGSFTLAGDGSVKGTPTSVADFDGDGRLDLATVQAGYDIAQWYPRILRGNGDGTFGRTLGDMGDTQVFSIPAIGDFNHDGLLDWATAGLTVLDISLNLGDGRLGGPRAYQILNASNSWNQGSSVSADLNGDGNLDIVTDALAVFLGNGNGTFRLNGGVFLNAQPYGLTLADFNNDNKLDAVFIGSDGAVQYQPSINLMFGNGDGTFQAPQISPAGNSALVAVGDFNGDGKLDLLQVGTDAITGESLLWVSLQTTLDISPGILNFGEVRLGTSKTLTATLTNFGQGDVSIDSIELGKQPVPVFSESNNCGSVLAAGASCVITVTFTPQAREHGYPTGSIYVTYGGAMGSPRTIPMSAFPI